MGARVEKGFKKNKVQLLAGWPGSRKRVLSGKEMGGVAAKERQDVSVVTAPPEGEVYIFMASIGE